MFCTKCGQQLPDNAVFCSKCGARLAAKGQHQPSTSKKTTGHWEYKEFTHRFEPLTVSANVDGGLSLSGQVDIELTYWLPTLKRDGWEPDESIEFGELMNKKRLHYTVETVTTGLFSKKKLITADAVTVKFKRWIE